MASFVTDMGKIRGRADTKLTRKSQRRLGKAIRRAKMMGLTPMLSRALPAPLTNTLGAVSDVSTLPASTRSDGRSEGQRKELSPDEAFSAELNMKPPTVESAEWMRRHVVCYQFLIQSSTTHSFLGCVGRAKLPTLPLKVEQPLHEPLYLQNCLHRG
jgi:hypothetical protein